ncbi:DUF4260 domain-containing protein [Chryseobacterium cheonjiense]|uniref:DUF4260 domain-containing protein n=1 Tax=Chryseobacterium cheonjiense TaxID=2728845 RepID=A0A7Y0FI45_9FLAO|nr:DUF4260 domain-containing protein [Chryseobacterium cheonjiense]NML56966.1 DUF4260 domain-containing protein [Chryseobacterium cheonjiense]
MKHLLQLEELGQFGLAIFLFIQIGFQWWLFPLCLLLPDVSMAGYLINSKIGAWLYNFFHHKLLAVFILVLGFYLKIQIVEFIGVILFAHSAMDRVFGYGLKFKDDFKHTHLGWIGKKS